LGGEIPFFGRGQGGGGGGGGGSSYIDDPGRYVRKVSGCGRLSPWGPLSIRGEPGMWGEARIPGKKGSSGGVSLSEGFHEGKLERGLLYWGTRKMRFLGDTENVLETGLLLHMGRVGDLEGVRLPGLLRDKKNISGFLSWTRRPLRF